MDMDEDALSMIYFDAYYNILYFCTTVMHTITLFITVEQKAVIRTCGLYEHAIAKMTK